MKSRTVKRVITSRKVQMGPVLLDQPLPIKGLEQISPFILLHHAGPKQHQAGKEALHIGAHPHRGFEPVTFLFSGELHHQDSLGNDSIISSGGVQWTTAGRGIVHSESSSKRFNETGGTFELIQLWVNLPADLKMSPPAYQGFQAKDIPSFVSEDGKARVNVVSGKFGELTGPINSLTNITAYTIMLEADGKIDLEAASKQNVMLYQLNGNGRVNGVNIGNKQLVEFENDGDLVILEAQSKSKLLFLTGKPINEPMASWGPYVMNTQTEILEAMRDYQMGKMGVLV